MHVGSAGFARWSLYSYEYVVLSGVLPESNLGRTRRGPAGRQDPTPSFASEMNLVFPGIIRVVKNGTICTKKPGVLTITPTGSLVIRRYVDSYVCTLNSLRTLERAAHISSDARPPGSIFQGYASILRPTHAYDFVRLLHAKPAPLTTEYCIVLMCTFRSTLQQLYSSIAG